MIHKTSAGTIAELQGKRQTINVLDDALDLLGNASYQEAQKVLIYSYQLHPDFFDLKTGFAGEVLQKFSTYRMQLAIVGEFENVSSKSLRDFIYESNKTGHVIFVASLEDALRTFS